MLTKLKEFLARALAWCREVIATIVLIPRAIVVTPVYSVILAFLIASMAIIGMAAGPSNYRMALVLYCYCMGAGTVIVILKIVRSLHAIQKKGKG